MAIPKTTIEILDASLNFISPIQTPYPLDKEGTILQYSKELSAFGQVKFRISAFDPILSLRGDILNPHQYHVRIRRGTAVVWQGAIIENSKRTSKYVEVIAAEYLFYLQKKLIHRTSPDTNGTANIFRIFNSGTMAAAVTAIMNETIADYAGSNHALKNMTLGTVDNPNYPPNFTDTNNNALTGVWNFSANLTLQFDFHTVLYVLKAFGIYSYADFYIDNNLVFNFKSFVGNNHRYDINFTYGAQGNILDYNLPRFGQRQLNSTISIATDPNGVILNSPQSDQSSISQYGLMEGVAAYNDVKSQNMLNARAQAELPFIATPDETNAIIILDERAYPLGTYDIGDIVTINVQNKGVNFNQIRRIVGITVQLNDTGREQITIQTNTPLAWQYGVT